MHIYDFFLRIELVWQRDTFSSFMHTYDYSSENRISVEKRHIVKLHPRIFVTIYTPLPEAEMSVSS